MWRERAIWALLDDPSQPLLCNVFSVVNTSTRNHDMGIASERFGKSATSVTYSDSTTPPSPKKYVQAYYSNTLRGVWSKARIPSLLIVTWSSGVLALCNKTFDAKFWFGIPTPERMLLNFKWKPVIPKCQYIQDFTWIAHCLQVQ